MLFRSYDPDRFRLSGYIRQGGRLLPIVNMEGWVSPSLNIRFNKGDPELEIYYPDGRKFLSTLEFNELVVETGQQLDLVTQERDRLLEQLRAMGINPD